MHQEEGALTYMQSYSEDSQDPQRDRSMRRSRYPFGLELHIWMDVTRVRTSVPRRKSLIDTYELTCPHDETSNTSITIDTNAKRSVTGSRGGESSLFFVFV